MVDGLNNIEQQDLYKSINMNEVYKFLYLMNNVKLNVPMDIGIASVRKVSDFVFVVEDIDTSSIDSES